MYQYAYPHISFESTRDFQNIYSIFNAQHDDASNGNIFRVTGHLWIPRSASDAEL